MTKKNKYPFSICLFLAIAILAWIWRIFLSASTSDDLPAPEVDISQGERCELLYVVDGDTVAARCNGRKESIRLLRINTPERHEPGYREATEALKTLLGAEPIIVVPENPDAPERDRFGRLLAYIFIADKNVNIEIVRQGWSRYWTKYGKGRYQLDFKAAEQAARSKKVGLWAF
jgi:micrococcal nuclease